MRPLRLGAALSVAALMGAPVLAEPAGQVDAERVAAAESEPESWLIRSTSRSR